MIGIPIMKMETEHTAPIASFGSASHLCASAPSQTPLKIWFTIPFLYSSIDPKTVAISAIGSIDGIKNNAWKNLFPLILKFKIIAMINPKVKPQKILAVDKIKVFKSDFQKLLSLKIV